MIVSFPGKTTSRVPVNVCDDPMCIGTAPAFMSYAKGSDIAQKFVCVPERSIATVY